MEQRSARLLKFSIFCTGITGIVAEYIMATLATWCLGDSVTQWTLIISLMLFAMGVGSQLSRFCRKNLFDTFIIVELCLALLVAASVIIIYTLFGLTIHLALFIYLLAFLVGLLVGFELPLATRINAQHEELPTNLSSMLSKDYFGALLGGIFFAFFALPHLGLPSSAALVGGLNGVVALLFVYVCYQQVRWRRTLALLAPVVGGLIIACFIFGDTVVLFSEQNRYQDKIIYRSVSRYQKIVITTFRDHYWLYLDGNQQFSTIDEHRYHEILVHPAMLLSGAPQQVLVLGGGDGLAAREILRHPSLTKLTVVDIDPQITELARTHPLLTRINAQALSHAKVYVQNEDAFTFLQHDTQLYDVIIADFPDPRSATLARLYTRQFFQAAFQRLRQRGVFITQAGSPLYARHAFLAVLKTIASLQPALPLHTYLPTMGDRGWVLAVKDKHLESQQLQARLATLPIESLPLRYLDRAALQHLSGGQGKNFYAGYAEIKINSLSNLSLHRYYRDGDWELY